VFGSYVFPCVAGAIITAPLYVPLFFGASWSGAMPILQLFLLMVVPLSLNSVLRDFLRGHKLILSYLRYQVVFVAIVLIACGLSALGDYSVFVASYVALTFLATLAYTRLVEQKTSVALWRSYSRLWAPLVASGVMYSVVWLYVERLVTEATAPQRLVVSLFLGGTVYAITYIALQYKQVKSVYTYIKTAIGKDRAGKVSRELPRDVL
jgi:O-antigen/teichoic acid export membrane protein